MAFSASENIITPVVSGAIQGSAYGILGLGLVLLYKGNRVFNFAQAQFGTIAALVCFAFLEGKRYLPELPYPVAAFIGVAAGTLMGLAVERLVVRPLFRQPKVTIVVATAGVTLLSTAVAAFFTGPNANRLRPIKEGNFLSGGLQITWQQVFILITLGVLAFASIYFFNRTPYGTAILAVSQEPTATSLVGISVNRISALTWGLAGFLGGVAGVLLGGGGFVTPAFLTTSALIPAFTAAVFGGITSLAGAFVGGIVIGIIEGLAGANIPSTVLPGANQVVLFAALLLVLLLKPAGLLGKET